MTTVLPPLQSEAEPQNRNEKFGHPSKSKPGTGEKKKEVDGQFNSSTSFMPKQLT